MPVPPTVPTSFVPRSSSLSSGSRRRPLDLGGAFGFVSYAILAVALLLAAGVFGYKYYLSIVLDAKDLALSKKVESIDRSQLNDLLRLENRLSSAKNLLNGHIALSSVFDLLEKDTLASVRLASLSVSFTNGQQSSLTTSGTAASFNAVAVQSAVLNKEPSLKNTLFSGLTFGKEGSVSFSVATNLDPSLFAFNPLSSNEPIAPTTEGTSSPPASLP